MSAATIGVDLRFFPSEYLDKAEQVFLNPTPRLTWEKIVPRAVAQNTFRGFHRVNKRCPGAKEGFVNYFLDDRLALVEALTSVSSRNGLHELSDHTCKHIRARLSNCSPIQLQSYNKIRKPVDLYFEHLVAIAIELDNARPTLTPLLFLPLDSQMLAHPRLFTERELAVLGLSRRSTYKDITTEQTYRALQELLIQKSDAISTERCRPFHVIYFDLLWNNRFREPGGNLFETNPS